MARIDSINKAFDPNEAEARLYTKWMTSNYFQPKAGKTGKKFSIVMPPPNITGQLHMGHALDNTLQDTLTRYKRMAGYETLWLPGTDHASIATEAKIVEAMRKEGLTKDDLGRDKFLERAWAWKEQYGGRIVEQLKKIGSSCDWSKERFTMDEGCSEAVKEVFVKYYNQGLIYRGERIINWCPHCLTSISNAEVDYADQAGHFWHLRYPFEDGTGYIDLATTRPETLLGDTAVAVNPKDERYKDVVGKMLVLPLVGRKIPVIADDYVDIEFGTGAVKITPAHDPNDFEVGQRHGLEVLTVLTADAKITEDYPKYAGMDRYEAREAIVKDLEEGGFLTEIEDYSHNVGTCYRCGTTIEPRVSLQWFVKMESLAKPAIEAVKDGSIRFVPERFSKNYFNWMEDIRDWCISRQLWWGHRIPAFYCDDCGELVVTKEDSCNCPKCGKEMRQDPDTLDTWFSSALWPFSTLGWPEKTEDLAKFYPTDTLVTGYDIITFWVSRMIVAGLAHMDDVPFRDVLIHGLVRDSQGRKMSKSLGNSPDPLDLIARYGADGVRMGILLSAPAGNDILYDDALCEQGRNFCNKIWNCFRLIKGLEVTDAEPSHEDREAVTWFTMKLAEAELEITDLMKKYRLSEALMTIYKLFTDEFSGWYLEMIKPAYQQPIARKTLEATMGFFEQMLRQLHPFMPFITEELWHNLAEREEGATIMSEDQSGWNSDELLAMDKDGVIRRQMEDMKQVVAGVRNIRASKNIPPKEKLTLISPAALSGLVCKLANCEVTLTNDQAGKDAEGAVSSFIVGTTEYSVPLNNFINKDEELAKLQADLQHQEGFLRGVMAKLSNERFVQNAKPEVVELERKKQHDAEQRIATIREAIAALSAI